MIVVSIFWDGATHPRHWSVGCSTSLRSLGLGLSLRGYGGGQESLIPWLKPYHEDSI